MDSSDALDFGGVDDDDDPADDRPLDAAEAALFADSTFAAAPLRVSGTSSRAPSTAMGRSTQPLLAPPLADPGGADLTSIRGPASSVSSSSSWRRQIPPPPSGGFPVHAGGKVRVGRKRPRTFAGPLQRVHEKLQAAEARGLSVRDALLEMDSGHGEGEGSGEMGSKTKGGVKLEGKSGDGGGGSGGSGGGSGGELLDRELFSSGPWLRLCRMMDLTGDWARLGGAEDEAAPLRPIPISTICALPRYYRRRLGLVVAVITHVSHPLGIEADAIATLCDPTGSINAAVQRKVLEEAGPNFAPGAAVALRNLFAFSPTEGVWYLNILAQHVTLVCAPATNA